MKCTKLYFIINNKYTSIYANIFVYVLSISTLWTIPEVNYTPNFKPSIPKRSYFISFYDYTSIYK